MTGMISVLEVTNIAIKRYSQLDWITDTRMVSPINILSTDIEQQKHPEGKKLQTKHVHSCSEIWLLQISF